MKKKLFFAALASIVLVGCTSNDFVGDTPPAVNGSGQAIAFGGNAGKVTRATSNSGTIARMLDHQFKVYGVKNTTAWNDVFVDYLVWDSQTKTTSNPDVTGTAGDRHGWEYVGAAGTYGAGSGSDGDDGTGVTIDNAQTIKYWDYSASNYHFVAGSPYANFKFEKNADGDIDYATVTGLAGHIQPNETNTAISDFYPVYIADPVNVPKADYQQEVTFNFRRQQARVRVGIFETIPGYSITEIHFYPMSNSVTTGTFDGIDARTDQYIVLNAVPADYFVGTASGNAKAKVTYDWSTATPTYSFEYTDGLTQSRTFYAGKMDGVLATTSTETTIATLYGVDGDMEATSGYFTVMPTPTATAAAPLFIKCDYVLTNEDGNGETIKVTGAKAAIPATYCKWAPNVSYTYLFKISDNTNGTTGTPGTDPEGLFPITFDAVVEVEEDGTEQGTITSVTTPSITTYQEGSVTETGIKYVPNKVITATVTSSASGSVLPIQGSSAVEGYVQVYSLGNPATAPTEADLQLTAPTEGAMSISISDNVLSFTPTAAGYYAIQYLGYGGAYTYKVVKVE